MSSSNESTASDDQHDDQFNDTDSDLESSCSSDSSDDSDSQFSPTIVDINSMSFCKTHKPGRMVRGCRTCSVAFTVITDKNLLSRLFESDPSPSTSSGLKSRYGGRCDEIVPTMSLSDEVLDTVVDILAKGKFHGRSTWKEVIKKYLVLPAHQHDKLMNDLKCEDLFNKFRRDKRFKNIFKYQGEVRDCLEMFRLSQRPLFSMMDHLNTGLIVSRQFGESIGLVYPKNPPPRCGVNVPRESTSRSCLDNLKPESAADIIPCQNLSEFLRSLNLRGRDRDMIFDFVEGYRASVGRKILDFYLAVAANLNNIEDLLVFYFDLLSHSDASMKEVIRSKLASLFKGDIRDDILNSIKSAEKSNSTGIFGGNFTYQFASLLIN